MKTDVIRFLLDEIDAEQDKIERYNAEVKRAKEEAGLDWNWLKFLRWNESIPRKSRIADNCKLARRLLLEISKENEEE